MEIWDENTMPTEQVDNDAVMAEIRESLLANLGQTIDGICKGTMQQMVKASRMSAENTLLWMVKQICRLTLERHPGDTKFVNEQADILVNSLFGQPNVSIYTFIYYTSKSSVASVNSLSSSSVIRT